MAEEKKEVKKEADLPLLHEVNLIKPANVKEQAVKVDSKEEKHQDDDIICSADFSDGCK